MLILLSKRGTHMKTQQRTRFERGMHEDIYLLSHDRNYCFKVSGASRNVYDLKFKKSKVSCSCPDFYGHAARYGCVCKHVCFIMGKVLGFGMGCDFFDRYVFSDDLWREFQAKYRTISLDNDKYANEEYIRRYTQMCDMDPEDMYQVKKQPEEDDMCPICFDGMSDNLLGCPVCHNAIHKKCMEKWLQMGKNTCVYCRNTVWRQYSKKQNGYVNLL